MGRKDGQKVRGNAQNRRDDDESPDIHPRAELAVDQTRQTHQQRKRARTEQVTDCFGNPQTALGKVRRPLAHRLLRRTGAEHQEKQQPENFCRKQLGKRNFIFFCDQHMHRHERIEECIEEGQQCPQKRQKLPVIGADGHKIDGGQNDDRHMSPAVERVEHAHGRGFFIARKRFDDRRDQNLGQTAADGIEEHGNHDTGERIDQIRQCAQRHKPEHGKHMRRDDGRTVADFVNILCADEINDDLDDEVHRNQCADFGQRDVKLRLERNKQQRGKIVDNGLRDVAEVACVEGMFVCELHGWVSFSVKKSIPLYRTFPKIARGWICFMQITQKSSCHLVKMQNIVCSVPTRLTDILSL